jgi:hypothetical protein
MRKEVKYVSLTRPLLDSLKVIDASVDNIIKYSVIGGEQVFGYHIQIYNNSNNILIYENKAFSFIFQINITSNLLINGSEYKLRMRTFNGNVLGDFSNIESNSSAFSEYLILKCYSIPTNSITNLLLDTSGNNMIKNQTFTFIGQYNQLQGVALKSFRYLLYDSNRILKQSFSEIYQTTGDLTQEITGFENNKTYYIELLTINQYNVESSSALIEFYVQYIQPRIRQILTATNDYDNASIKVDAKIVRVQFEGENYTFENDGWINLKNGYIHIKQDESFNVDRDFTLKLWLKDITASVDFLTIVGENGQIRTQLRDNRFHTYKEYNDLDLYSHYGSDLITNYNNETVFFIFIQQVNGMLNLKFEK